ncbi:MAG TPA: hypothetical protein VF600_17595 [Abditibacteriaceae bacterium]|jgi:hypothetical protein
MTFTSTPIPVGVYENTAMLERIDKTIRRIWPQGGSPKPETVKQLSVYLSPISDTLDHAAGKVVYDVRKRLLGRLPNYSPRLYEAMLSEAAKLLNRCEAYRREADIAAGQAIQDAYAFVLKEALLHNRQLLLDKSTTAANTARSTNYHQAAQAFGESAEPLAQGNQKLADADSTFIASVTEIEEKRTSLSRDALEIEREFQNVLRMQQQMFGSALNNVNRYERLLRLFLEDLDEAYERLIAATLGMAYSHSTGPLAGWLAQADNKLPVSKKSGPDNKPIYEFNFDDLISWTRKAMRQVDLLSLQDREVVIPVIIGGKLPTNIASYRGESAIAVKLLNFEGQRFYKPAEILANPALEYDASPALVKATRENLENGKGKGEIRFTMPIDSILGHLNTYSHRLIGVGVGYLCPEDNLENEVEQTRRFRIRINRQPNFYYLENEEGQPLRKPDGTQVRVGEPVRDIFLRSVGMVKPDGSFMEAAGPELAYDSPFGEWKITVDELGTYGAGVFERDAANITGLVLYLRLILGVN